MGQGEDFAILQLHSGLNVLELRRIAFGDQECELPPVAHLNRLLYAMEKESVLTMLPPSGAGRKPRWAPSGDIGAKPY